MLPEQSKTQDFRQEVVTAATSVVSCASCRKATPETLGLPQPIWVGHNYQPGHGIVFLLQNPSGSGQKRAGEISFRDRLTDFAAVPTVETYQAYVADMVRQLPHWAMWTHPVGKIVEGCATPDDIAWVNVVKSRTINNALPTPGAVRHGKEVHLKQELKLLQPAVVVSVGRQARKAIDEIYASIELSFVRESIGQRCTTSDAYDLRNRLSAFLNF